MKCEYCGKEHDGSYGSGRFCSKHCRGAFVASNQHTGYKSNKHWECRMCGQTFTSRKNMYNHLHTVHNQVGTWNKGLTKETDPRIRLMAEQVREGYMSGRITSTWKGKQLPDEMKKKISQSMKIAHKEGRAHNIGESRWNNKPSWPEIWFMRVVKNEFSDKNYVREMPFHRFSLDFAWKDKKKCIEIDGDQHWRFEEYKERDKRKDEALANEGWQVLRLVWRDVYHEPKKYIQLAKDFIGS